MDMITKFNLFEKQLQLFDLPSTDTDIARHVITKHHTTPTANIGHKNLKDEFNVWSDKTHELLYDFYINDIELDSSDFSDLLYNSKDEFFDYIKKHPKNVSKQWKEENKRKGITKLIQDIEDDDDWYLNIDKYIEDLDEFKDTFVRSLNNLFEKCNSEYFYDLENAIYNSEDPKRLQIYRAITLPSNIEELDDYDGIGIYWTYDMDKSEAYWSRYHRDFILEGWVYTEGIDWKQTVYASLYGLKEEREIRLYSETPIQLTNVYMESSFDDLNDDVEERKRISKLFNLPLDKVMQHLNGKYRNMTKLTFDEPFWVKA